MEGPPSSDEKVTSTAGTPVKSGSTKGGGVEKEGAAAGGVRTEVMKKSRQVPQSLLRNTAATAAKSIKTKEELKVGGARGGPVRLFGRRHTVAPAPAPATKPVSGTRPLTSTAMKAPRDRTGAPPSTVRRKPQTAVKMPRVAVSSFIAEELKEDGESVRTDCQTPDHQEWDASAIAPPENRTLMSVINSSVASNPSRSLGQTNPSLANDSKKAERALLQAQHDKDAELADAYLISALIKTNIKQQLERVSEECDAQVAEVFEASEKSRAEMLRMREENEKMKNQLELISTYEKVRDALDKLKLPEAELQSLLNGLRQCRNHLKVSGLKLGKNTDGVAEELCEVLSKYKEELSKDPLKSSAEQSEMSVKIEAISQDLTKICQSYNKCKEGKEEVRKAATHIESLRNPGTNQPPKFNLRSAMDTE